MTGNLEAVSWLLVLSVMLDYVRAYKEGWRTSKKQSSKTVESQIKLQCNSAKLKVLVLLPKGGESDTEEWEIKCKVKQMGRPDEELLSKDSYGKEIWKTENGKRRGELDIASTVGWLVLIWTKVTLMLPECHCTQRCSGAHVWTPDLGQCGRWASWS